MFLGKMETWRYQKWNLSNMSNIFTQSDVYLIWMPKEKKNDSSLLLWTCVREGGEVGSQFHFRDMIYRIQLEPTQANKKGGHWYRKHAHHSPLSHGLGCPTGHVFFFFFSSKCFWWQSTPQAAIHPRTEQRVCVRSRRWLDGSRPLPPVTPHSSKHCDTAALERLVNGTAIFCWWEAPCFFFLFCFFLNVKLKTWAGLLCRSAPVRLRVAFHKSVCIDIKHANKFRFFFSLFKWAVTKLARLFWMETTAGFHCFKDELNWRIDLKTTK